ncbi:MAG: glutamate synthase-related protein [Verrucomicrobiota bacterium]
MTAHTNIQPGPNGDPHLVEHTLYDREFSHDSCGVGFITSKSGKQSHDLLLKGHEALCEIPHRGGMSSQGVGDGAGVNIDLSRKFFAKLLGRETLEKGQFGVANFFFPHDPKQYDATRALIENTYAEHELPILLWRKVDINPEALSERALAEQQQIEQIVFGRPESLATASDEDFDQRINDALIAIEAMAYNADEMAGFYPLSMSARTMVYKGRLNSGEVIPYFKDLSDPDHEISIFLFHTRFSTNTAPATFMSQPFRWMAHNGELNTDKKNRLSEDAIAKQKNKRVIFPKGQSDSARLDQTLARRIIEDKLDIVTAVVAMMPCAWENDSRMKPHVRAMYEYFSLYEEKNDGPAALVFSDGIRVGAKLDRMGLRPLRSVETEEYLAVTSEAGQIEFPANEVIRRGRIESGGIIYFDHSVGKTFLTDEVNEKLAQADDYTALVKKRAIHIDDLPEIPIETLEDAHELSIAQRHVAYSMNQESFRFLLDPMIVTAGEKISAMGYGVANNTMSQDEGGMSKYFSQRFAQVTNPPLDSIREKDGMTLRVALGSKPNFSDRDTRQIILESPILQRHQLEQIRTQKFVAVSEVSSLYTPSKNRKENEENLENALNKLCDEVEALARKAPGVIVISDKLIGLNKAPMPAMLTIAAANQRLIESGLRFNVSLIMETGRAASSHDIASLLGFGAHAICPLTVHNRVVTLNDGKDLAKGLDNFQKAIAKSLLKTMGKFGLCTVESYIGGEFFESNYLDTADPRLAPHFPNLNAPVGGAGFAEIAASTADWYYRALSIHQETDIPHLGLFKERQGGAGHTFGLVAVQEYKNMTDEDLLYTFDEEIEHIFNSHQLNEPKHAEAIKAVLALCNEIGGMVDEQEDVTKTIEQTFVYYGLDAYPQAMSEVQAVLTRRVKQSQAQIIDDLFQGQHDEEPAQIQDALNQLVADSTDPQNQTYKLFGFERRTPEQIDNFTLTRAYRNFVKNIAKARAERPAALRDIMYFPADVRSAKTVEDFEATLGRQNILGNAHLSVQGMSVSKQEDGSYRASLSTKNNALRLTSLGNHWSKRFPGSKTRCESEHLVIESVPPIMEIYLDKLIPAPEPLELEAVQPAHEITPCLTAGAMSHGALVGIAHEAVSQGANIAGALSNSGEGGEKARRFNTIKSSSIKQIASGRFGVWAGYFADPNLKEIEIKIAQGAKPGEGGQLPAPKVNVEIASARGGTPLVELVSPPPHHDTYSIEDLAQLIHDAHAARVKVIVKLVSSEGIGTIAVGVAKAGADVINVAGGTGGTGAAAVTSLKNTGRSAELGIAEVHKALCLNGIREKVVLRASNAHQTGSDVVKSAILGADSFEFGTTALMMLKCVMAKNCNVKCPAGLTTNPEVFEGDARALAQYFMNTAHDVRRILARLGYPSLLAIRGKTHLLHLIEHRSIVGKLDFRDFLSEVEPIIVKDPAYMEADFSVDDLMLTTVREELLSGKKNQVIFEGPSFKLGNRNKTVGGQLAIDIERILAHKFDQEAKQCTAIHIGKKGRRFLAPESIVLRSTHSAGQSYACWMNDGMLLQHTGTCNDGVGKGACGGIAVVKSPGGGSFYRGENVLIGNFALFGASGGQLYVNGEAGDRFAVRNSGALAVVEGVGDFCCEYMTSGTVLNLGGFGKGFCNGMSGGNAYQYDPEDKLGELHSADSVIIKSIDDETDEAAAHEIIIKSMLAEHIDRTDSVIASKILSRWSYEKKFFKYAIPRSLFKTQTIEGILESLDRKAILEELAFANAADELQVLIDAYKHGNHLLNGQSPSYGEMDTPEMFKLINSYSILSKAVDMARDQLKRKGLGVAGKQVDQLARSLIVNQDRKLLEAIAKNIKSALEVFSVEELASKLMRKRINDYKVSMLERDVQDNNSLGSTAWILQQERHNIEVLNHRQRFEEHFAEKVLKDLI